MHVLLEVCYPTPRRVYVLATQGSGVDYRGWWHAQRCPGFASSGMLRPRQEAQDANGDRIERSRPVQPLDSLVAGVNILHLSRRG